MAESAYGYRLWEVGQTHLAAGRYGAARRALESSAEVAVRGRDLGLLARVYLPLLETRRLLRYRAAEGRIILAANVAEARRQAKGFLRQTEGTLVIGGAERAPAAALRLAQETQRAALRSGQALEALLLLGPAGGERVASPAAPARADGVRIHWTQDAAAPVEASTEEALSLPLPVAGEYDGRTGLGVLARESLLVAWEALALQWQARHPLGRRGGPWEEIAWLRAALAVDPACEPVTMRLIALAEGMQRASVGA